ncbi:MAG: penicillin-binding protein 2 [Candidatus Pacebacteria bacterium]|jgi:cell division protein FtsI/penicillin-binding protein 2|nr:penicillin-binding protein 2 [Candidatus Paceibacterota bacterium]
MDDKLNSSRKKLFLTFIGLTLALIIARLFYWQILRGQELKNLSEQQTIRSKTQEGLRGQIYTSDGYLLVGNQEVYDLKLDRQNFEGDVEKISQKLAAIIARENWQFQDASDSASKILIQEQIESNLINKFTSQANWPQLAKQLSIQAKEEILALNNPYLAFDTSFARFYPEASMAAHITGFVGRDDDAKNIGRYGVEGALEDELKPRKERGWFHTDALGALLAGSNYQLKNLNGRDLTLTIRRDVQYVAETNLAWGIEHYDADRGEIIILDSQSGKILALATWPNYQQWQYFKYPGEILKNPSLTRLYEPGSTFKVLTVASAIDAGVINPETVCTKCAGPRKFGTYTIRTWNDEYHPNINITEALEKSDNIAMIFVGELLGREKFSEYLKKFGVGQSLSLNLQDDSSTYFPQKIGPVELATISFGQGISTNSFQLLRAVNAIANKGIILEPKILEKVYDQQLQKEILVNQENNQRVISPETAALVTKMMVSAASHGEAQWIASKRYTVAAKTGTSQVADPKGGYKSDETIASFIGFAPADSPQFTMLVKLENPKSSPWAAETAAPLWYKTADKLMILFNITPDLN